MMLARCASTVLTPGSCVWARFTAVTRSRAASDLRTPADQLVLIDEQDARHASMRKSDWPRDTQGSDNQGVVARGPTRSLRS
jgi:hypothetical protein